MSDLALIYRIREALGFNQYYGLSHLDDDARAMRAALLACAPIVNAIIKQANEHIGYIGQSDNEFPNLPVSATIQTTIGAIREARRALFVAGVHENA